MDGLVGQALAEQSTSMRRCARDQTAHSHRRALHSGLQGREGHERLRRRAQYQREEESRVAVDRRHPSAVRARDVCQRRGGYYTRLATAGKRSTYWHCLFTTG